MSVNIKVGQVVVLPALPRAGRWESIRVVVKAVEEWILVEDRHPEELMSGECLSFDEVAVLGCDLINSDNLAKLEET